MSIEAQAKEVVLTSLLKHVQRYDGYLERAPEKYHAEINRVRNNYVRRIERVLA